MSHRIAFAASAFGLVLLACSGAPPDDGSPDYEPAAAPARTSDGNGGDTPAPQPTSEPTTPPSTPPTENPTTPVTKPATPYAGALASTATVPFGGGTYCKYDITLKNVAIDLGVLESGEIQSMTVKDTAVEHTPSCPYPVMPQSNQVFTFAKATKGATSTRVELTGAKENKPATSLVADLVPTATGFDATFTWKRTDQTGVLGWTVTAKIPLARK